MPEIRLSATLAATLLALAGCCCIDIDPRALPSAEKPDELVSYLNAGLPKDSWLHVHSLQKIAGADGAVVDSSSVTINLDADLSRALDKLGVSQAIKTKIKLSFERRFLGKYEDPYFYRSKHVVSPVELAESVPPGDTASGAIITKVLAWEKIAETTTTGAGLSASLGLDLKRAISQVDAQDAAEEQELAKAKTKATEAALDLAASYQSKLQTSFSNAVSEIECDWIDVASNEKLSIFPGETHDDLPGSSAIRSGQNGTVDLSGSQAVLLYRQGNVSRVDDLHAVRPLNGDRYVFHKPGNTNDVYFIFDIVTVHSGGGIDYKILRLSEDIRRLVQRSTVILRWGDFRFERQLMQDSLLRAQAASKAGRRDEFLAAARAVEERAAIMKTYEEFESLPIGVQGFYGDVLREGEKALLDDYQLQDLFPEGLDESDIRHRVDPGGDREARIAQPLDSVKVRLVWVTTLWKPERDLPWDNLLRLRIKSPEKPQAGLRYTQNGSPVFTGPYEWELVEGTVDEWVCVNPNAAEKPSLAGIIAYGNKADDGLVSLVVNVGEQSYEIDLGRSSDLKQNYMGDAPKQEGGWLVGQEWVSMTPLRLFVALPGPTPAQLKVEAYHSPYGGNDPDNGEVLRFPKTYHAKHSEDYLASEWLPSPESFESPGGDGRLIIGRGRNFARHGIAVRITSDRPIQRIELDSASGGVLYGSSTTELLWPVPEREPTETAKRLVYYKFSMQKLSGNYVATFTAEGGEGLHLHVTRAGSRKADPPIRLKLPKVRQWFTLPLE